MANRNGYIERDRHGRERLIITSTQRRASSRSRLSTRELLNAAEEREDVLIIRNQQLESQLAWSQGHEQRAKSEYNQIVAQLQSQADATRRVQERLQEEKDKSTALEDRVRMMQRTSYESYRQRYEDLLLEVEDLRAGLRSKDEAIRLNGLKLEKRNQLILELKGHLMRLGFRVVGTDL